MKHWYTFRKWLLSLFKRPVDTRLHVNADSGKRSKDRPAHIEKFLKED